jgi:hypothetical protein
VVRICAPLHRVTKVKCSYLAPFSDGADACVTCGRTLLEAVGGKITGQNPTALDIHLHPKPCKDELSWAIRDLLDDREPLETGGPSEDFDEEVDDEQPSGPDRKAREREERRERRFAWKESPLVEREREALQLLGDDRLTIKEITERFNEAHPEPDIPIIFDTDVRPLMYRLLHAREVDRKAEPRVPGGKAVRHRYFRRQTLEGPIVDLERTFREGTDGLNP